jgi:hypothetical protein
VLRKCGSKGLSINNRMHNKNLKTEIGKNGHRCLSERYTLKGV